MKKEELVKFYLWLAEMAVIDDEVRCTGSAKFYAQKFIDSSHQSEAPKVGKHEESKEVCAHIWNIIDPNTWKCTKCPGVIKWK